MFKKKKEEEKKTIIKAIQSMRNQRLHTAMNKWVTYVISTRKYRLYVTRILQRKTLSVFNKWCQWMEEYNYMKSKGNNNKNYFFIFLFFSSSF